MNIFRKIFKFQARLREFGEDQIVKQIKKISNLIKLQKWFRQQIAENKLIHLKRQKSIGILFR